MKRDHLWKKAPKKKRNVMSIAKNFTTTALDILFDLANGFVEVSLDRRAAYRILNEQYGGWTPQRSTKVFYDLQRYGYLKCDKSNQNSVSFTNKAKLRLLEKISSRAKLDHQLRFVSFDIPEDLSIQRNRFRRAIKRIGFRQVQKSLWVIDRDVGSLVDLASEEYKVEKYMIYIISERTDIDSIISDSLRSCKNRISE